MFAPAYPHKAKAPKPTASMRAVWIGIWMLLAPLVQAQVVGSTDDTLSTLPAQDTTVNQPLRTEGAQVAAPDTAAPIWPNPGKAALYSVIFPGLGQVYNRDWWKVPIVWTAVGTAGYFIVYNHVEFTRYRTLTRESEEPLRVQHRTLRDFHRRNRDFTILLTALGYALVAVEAYVDAHLYYFDVSDNLSMAIKPGWMMAGSGQPRPTLGFSMQLGK